MFRLVALCALIALATCANILAGVATVDATLPIGVPLAGYNHGDRRVKKWPIPTFTKYTTFMTPSIGVAMPLWAKCLALSDSNTTFVLATIDAIGADGGLFQEALKIARDQGYKTSVENTILSASHSHSGPGAVSSELLWELAPATDMIKPALRTQMASSIASCLIEAEQNLKPARVGLGTGQVTTASHNRRAHFSPYVTLASIDSQLGVIRVDDVNGKNIANLWNFAIHGTCLGEDNMYMHGDIMGVTNQLLEQETGVPALFVNSDAGDIAPSGCEQWKGSRILADAIKATSASITTLADAEFHVVSKIVPFGPTNMNLTLHRLNNCTSGGHIDMCTICSQKVLDCHANLHLDNNWIEDMPKFTAIRVKQNNKNTLIVTAPGEAINELGNQIKADAKAMNFDQTFLFGYSNNHMAYFTTEREYDVGGYESIMTFWGYNTSHIVREGCSTVANLVKP